MKILLLLFLYLTIPSITIAQASQIKVIASAGDGVYSILRNNGFEPTKYYKAFIELNKDSLTLDNGLVKGRTYRLPTIQKKDSIVTIETPPIVDKTKPKISDNPLDSKPTVKHINYPLFGKDYAHVPLENNMLNGTIYYLISGHGGPDPGAIETYNGKLISEDEYAYDVTLRLARRLISYGAKVYIIIKDKNDGIRDKKILEVDYDEVNFPNKPISKNQKLRLRQRTKTVNSLYLKHKGAYQRLIVTHVDSRSKGKNIDVFFYHHYNSKSGKRLAKNIHQSFKEKYAKYQPNRTYSGSVKSRGLYLVKKTLPAMVYIELGNIKSKKDQKRILNYHNRKALAKWIFNGLVVDFNESKKLY
ncbi:N-acetylmuramoyl-L-alanine amidase [Flavivirga abyssicola]|uniref:N-acetylmuramoyl-L-alanine amidase family protein n=1 Tax=Flavivirga abyssicola TaxID=3063533 RepID=UPI0026E03D6C|nr:N-acetylmuramoyl-L-alanine amidase [Flavivirga sp. MEBiC07777]WVK11823.1 N-acetylmuramoyl-L-alanine amidase [Flavivirga sp. MEBiC07777]